MNFFFYVSVAFDLKDYTLLLSEIDTPRNWLTLVIYVDSVYDVSNNIELHY